MDNQTLNINNKQDYNILFKEGGVTAPKGFYASSAHAGLKNDNKLDLTIVYSQEKCNSASLFTKNKVPAAPVTISRKKTRWGRSVSAVIINSGNANSCTGKQGIKDAKAMSNSLEKHLSKKNNKVTSAVCSTGIIGKQLPIKNILDLIPELVKNANNTKENGSESAISIMTSDTIKKEISVNFNINNDKSQENKITIGAMTKGAGMINPNMATMLAIITTDVKIHKRALKKALKNAVEKSFNRITIDGDTSTNDTVLIMANGLAENDEITLNGENYKIFEDLLTKLCKKLAHSIVSDGERISKVVTIQVENAKSKKDAEAVARSVANSILVKCSIAGNDANWGRVMHAIGNSTAKIDTNKIDIYFGEEKVTSNSIQAKDINIENLKQIVNKKDFTIKIDLKIGKKDYSVLTTDLTEGYVNYNLRENALF